MLGASTRDVAKVPDAVCSIEKIVQALRHECRMLECFRETQSGEQGESAKSNRSENRRRRVSALQSALDHHLNVGCLRRKASDCLRSSFASCQVAVFFCEL